MDQAAQVKRQPISCDNLDKMINFISQKNSDQMEPSQPAFTIPNQLDKHDSPLP